MATESFSNKNPERDTKCQEAAEKAGHSDWWDWTRALEKEMNRTICAAPRRGRYIPCKRPAAPNGRCVRYHGGDISTGPTHPAYRHGMYSKEFDYLPGYLRDRAKAVAEDESLIQSREQIAVLDAHSKNLLDRGLNTGESGAAWKAIAEWLSLLVSAIKKEDERRVADCIKKLRELAANGVGENLVWREYQSVIENQRRAKETELNRMKALSAFIAADRATTLFQKLIEIVQGHVEDPDVLRLILLDVDKVFGRGSE